MAKTILMPNTVTNAYKNTSKAINEIDLGSKPVIRKSLVDIMRQSFFHGSYIYGGTTNFIA